MYKSFLLSLLLFCVFLSTPSASSGAHDYSFKVSRGDAFYKFFFSTGLSGKLLKKLMASDERAQKLNKIYPGDKFRIVLNANHELDQIIYSPANDNPLFITYDGKSFNYGKTSIQPIGELSQTIITIKKSLNYDAKKAGVGAEVIKMMVDHFSWEMDFSRDLRKGDKFMLSWNGEKTPIAMVYVGTRKLLHFFHIKIHLVKRNTSPQKALP